MIWLHILYNTTCFLIILNYNYSGINFNQLQTKLSGPVYPLGAVGTVQMAYEKKEANEAINKAYESEKTFF